MDCMVVLWLFAKPGVWLVRGFIGIYAVLTDRMERPIGQSMRFFIIVLDTVILLAFDQCLYISSSPSQIQEELRLWVCPSKETTYLLFDDITSRAVYLLFIFQL